MCTAHRIPYVSFIVQSIFNAMHCNETPNNMQHKSDTYCFYLYSYYAHEHEHRTAASQFVRRATKGTMPNNSLPFVCLRSIQNSICRNMLSLLVAPKTTQRTQSNISMPKDEFRIDRWLYDLICSLLK